MLMFNYFLILFKECRNSCMTCEDTADKCLTCNVINTNRIDDARNSSTCICIDGYYDDFVNSDCKSKKLLYFIK